LLAGLSGLLVPAVVHAAPRACAQGDPREAEGCFEACQLPASADARPSDPFLAKLRALPATGHHVMVNPGPWGATALADLRVTSVPFDKEAAGRWRQNGLWAGPCAGLTSAFQATAVSDKDPKKVVDLYELRYGAETSARRVAALLGTSWNWNGHPFIVVQRGPSVIVVEGRYGAWGALEAVGAHFGGAVTSRRAPVALALCDKRPNRRPLVSEDGLRAHVLGFAPSGELAWLTAAPGEGGGTLWTVHVTNLVNDREVVARTYRTASPTPEAFCAEHRAEAGLLLADNAVTGGDFSAFDRAGRDSEPLTVSIDPGKEIVMHGAQGSKVLGKLPASAGEARTLGFIRSPFEERVAVLVLITDGKTGRPGLRVLGGRLDKRWIARR
jgi:hypothetical protein